MNLFRCHCLGKVLKRLRAETDQSATRSQIISVSLETGRARPLDPTLLPPDEASSDSPRQEPPVLDGSLVSEIIIEQRKQ